MTAKEKPRAALSATATPSNGRCRREDTLSFSCHRARAFPSPSPRPQAGRAKPKWYPEQRPPSINYQKGQPGMTVTTAARKADAQGRGLSAPDLSPLSCLQVCPGGPLEGASRPSLSHPSRAEPSRARIPSPRRPASSGDAELARGSGRRQGTYI